jgi:hypothetical protein
LISPVSGVFVLSLALLVDVLKAIEAAELGGGHR